MNKEDKLIILNNIISNFNYHISILEEDIKNNPDADVPGKETRQSVLQDFILKLRVIENEKQMVDQLQ